MAGRLDNDKLRNRILREAYGNAENDQGYRALVSRQKQEEEEQKKEATSVDWSDVKTGSDTFVQPAEEPSGFANLINQIVRPATDYASDMGTMAKADIKAGLGARMFTHDDIGNGAGAEVGRSLYDSLNIQGGGPISSLLQTLSGNREDTGELGKRLYQEANATKSEVNKEYKDSNWAAQGGIDLAGSPLSALSVIGGPTAFITGEDVFNKTYTESRLAGASQGASASRAGAHSTIETGIAAIPAGKLFSKIPGVNRLVPREGLVKLMGDAQQFAVRTGLTMAGESAEEVTTSLAQMGLDRLIADNAEDAGVRKVAEANLPKSTAEFFDTLRRTAVAGAAGGVALGSPIEMMNIMREGGAAAAQMLTTMDASNKDKINEKALADAPRSTAIAPTPTQDDMFGTPEGLPSFEDHTAERQRSLEIDEGLRQGRNAINQEETLAASREEQRLNLEGSVDASRQRVEALQDSVENGDTSPQTLSAMNAAVRDLKRAEKLLANHEAAAPAQAQSVAPIAAEPGPPQVEPTQPDLFGIVEQAKTPEAKAAKKAKAAKAPKPKKPVLTVAAEVDGFLKGLAKGDENSNPTTGVKVADVAKALVSSFGQGNTKKLAKLITDQNLEIVADVSQIPEGAAPAGAHGFYDGNRMYVVANRLDPKNVVGGMLEVVAHEIKHAADISGKLTMGEFVGKKANASLNAQIQAAAARGDVAAQRAMEAAKAGSTSAAEFALELPAYYINESRDTRGASRTAILRDALSAVRTTAKRIMPGTYEVSLSDVAYLSDKLIAEAAVQGKKLDGDINGGLAMIYDRTATGFDKAKAENRTYESADGTEKFVLSDSEAKLHPEAHKRLTRRSSRATKLSDILEHDVLFEQHPEAKDIEVYVASEAEMGDSFGLYLPTDIVSNGFITIRRDVADGTKQDNDLRQALMHEVQHWVQDRSARRDNFFDKNKLPKPEGYDAWQKEYEESRRANDRANRKFLDNAKLIRELVMPGAAKNVERVLFDKNLENHQKVREILDYLDDADALDDPRIESLAAGVASTKVAHNEAAKKINDGLDDYFKNLTEREAFYTQDTIDTPQEKLPVNPEADMRVDSPDKTLRDQIGRSLPLGRGEMPARGRASGPVSQIVKHGTPHSFEPEEGHRIGKFRDDKMGTGEGSKGLAFTPRVRAVVEPGGDMDFLFPAYRIVKRLLGAGGAFGAKLDEALQHSKQLGSEGALEGDFLGNEMLRAIHKNIATNAAYRAKGEQWLRDTITERIEAIDKLDTRDARDSAMRAMDREFPGVGTAVANLRAFKLDLTRQIIAMRMRDPKELTDKERATYAKMVENAERYTTRAYLATYNKEVGQTYGKKLLAKAKKDPNSEQGKTLAAALDYLVQNELTIPDPIELAALGSIKLRRLHGNWIGPADNFKGANGKIAMINALTDYKNNNVMDLDEKAMEVAMDMLGLTGAKSRLRSAYTGGAKQNRTILEGRTDLPPELRKLMGEITDPFLRESISLYRMTNLIAKTKLLTEVFEKGKGEGWYADKRSAKFSEQLNGQAYGPLDGKWISVDTSDALTGTILNFTNLDDSIAESLRNPSALMQWAGSKMLPISHHIMGLQKTWQVVASFANMGLNLAGSPLMAIGQGIINPKTYAKGMAGAMSALTLEVTSKYAGRTMIDRAKEVVLAGAVDSATMGEFKTEAYQTIVKQINKLDANDKSFMWKAGKLVVKELFAKGVTANTLRQFYAFMDVWVKTATYFDRKNFLTAYYKAEGITKTDEEIMRQAGYEAAGTNISYERAIPLVKMIERNAPFAMFLTYFSEVPRAVGMSYIQVARDAQMAIDAKTPEGKALAAGKASTRLIGTLIANVGVVAATLAALDSDDDEEKRRRALDADYQQNRIMVPMGKDENGNDKMFTVNRIDPYGPLNEFIIDLIAAPKDKKGEAILKNVKDLFVPSKGWVKTYQIIHDATIAQAMPEWDMKRNKNTLTEKNNPDMYNMISDFAHSVDLGENFVSAAEALLLPVIVAPAVDKDRHWSGYKPYVRDPDKSLSFRAMDYDKGMKKLKTEQKDFVSRQGRMDVGEVAERMQELVSKEKDLYTDIRKAYDGYLAYPGKTPKDAAGAMGDSKQALSRARSLEFRSSLLDQKSLQTWYKDQLKKDGVDRDKLRKDYKLLKQTYLEVRDGDG